MKQTVLISTILVILIFCTFGQPLQAADWLDIKLRVYEGTRQGMITPPEFITSSYIQPTINANLRLSEGLEEEEGPVRD